MFTHGIWLINMSTRESIWYGEQGKSYVHIYWELADRDVAAGRKLGKMVAPVYLSVECDLKDVDVRLPKDTAEQLLDVLKPDWRNNYEVI